MRRTARLQYTIRRDLCCLDKPRRMTTTTMTRTMQSMTMRKRLRTTMRRSSWRRSPPCLLCCMDRGCKARLGDLKVSQARLILDCRKYPRTEPGGRVGSQQEPSRDLLRAGGSLPATRRKFAADRQTQI